MDDNSDNAAAPKDINPHVNGNQCAEPGSNVSSTNSSEEIEIGKGGHNLRRRVQDGAGNWRDESRTPSPMRSSPCEETISTKRGQYQKKAARSFAEMSKEYEEKEKLAKILASESNKKTMEDFVYKGVAKRNVPFSVQRWLAEMNRKLCVNANFMRNLMIIFVLLFGVVISGIVFLRSSEIGTTATFVSWKNAQSTIIQDIKKLSQHFPSQNKETAVHLISAVNSTLSLKEPRQPSSVTLLIPPSMIGSSFPSCYANKFGSVVNEVFSHVLNASISPIMTLDGQYFERYGEDITEIHNQLKAYFNKGGKAILVKDIEKIKEEKHILIFHSLCDNFKAPDKRATIFFLLHVSEEIYGKWKWDQKYAAHISNDVLDMALKTVISDDSRPAIIARIAATVVLLNPGDLCSESDQ